MDSVGRLVVNVSRDDDERCVMGSEREVVKMSWVLFCKCVGY